MKSMAWRVLCMVGMALVPAFGEAQSVAELVQGSEFRYTKGDIDIQVLSGLIADRQKALSADVLHRHLLKQQAGSISQNILTERLIHKMLQDHSPKEVTQAVYTYALETFALGMMATALEKSPAFQFPSACRDMNRMSDSCRSELEESKILSHLVKGRNSYPNGAKLPLTNLRRAFIMDRAFLAVAESNNLFGKTLFNTTTHGMSQVNVKSAIDRRWGEVSSELQNLIVSQIRENLFEAANSKLMAIRKELRRQVVSEYVASDLDSTFRIWRTARLLDKEVKAVGFNLIDACPAIKSLDSAPTIQQTYDAIVSSKGCIEAKKQKYVTWQLQMLAFDREMAAARDVDLKSDVYDPPVKINFDALDRYAKNASQKQLDSVKKIADDDTVALLRNANQLQILSLYLIDSLDMISDEDSAKWKQRIDSSVRAVFHRVVKENNGGLSFTNLIPSVLGEDNLIDAKRARETGESLRNISKYIDLHVDCYRGFMKIERPYDSYKDTLNSYERISRIAGLTPAPEAKEKLIQQAKKTLDTIVVKDSGMIALISNYDKYLNVWLTNEGSANDTLSILFLQRFLPSLRIASFTDVGLKKLYKSSIPLLGIVDIRDLTPNNNGVNSIDPIIIWLANYSTRTRSQNLQSALRLLRENDSLFARIFPSDKVREWFWLITDNLDIDTAKDVISMDIPKTLIEVEKKYLTEAKTAFYPVLDIGFTNAYFLQKNSHQLIQFASEKIGVGLALHRNKGCPTEKLIEDPEDISRNCSCCPYLNKIGVELFGSGLLYNSTNMKTKKTFNDAIISLGLSANFRVGLTGRVAMGAGFNQGHYEHLMGQVSVDVPLADYLTELGKK